MLETSKTVPSGVYSATWQITNKYKFQGRNNAGVYTPHWNMPLTYRGEPDNVSLVAWLKAKRKPNEEELESFFTMLCSESHWCRSRAMETCVAMKGFYVQIYLKD